MTDWPAIIARLERLERGKVKDVRAKIVFELRSNGVTQKKIAEMLGLNRCTVAMSEARGKRLARNLESQASDSESG